MPTKEELAKAEADAKAKREAEDKEAEAFIASVPEASKEDVRLSLQWELEESKRLATEWVGKIRVNSHRGADVVQGLKDCLKHELAKKKAILDRAKASGVTLTE